MHHPSIRQRPPIAHLQAYVYLLLKKYRMFISFILTIRKRTIFFKTKLRKSLLLSITEIISKDPSDRQSRKKYNEAEHTMFIHA